MTLRYGELAGCFSVLFIYFLCIKFHILVVDAVRLESDQTGHLQSLIGVFQDKVQQEIPVCTHLRRKCNRKFLYAQTLEKMQQEIPICIAHTLGENAIGNLCMHTS